MQSTAFSLRGVAGLFEASKRVSPTEFRAFATPLFAEQSALSSVSWLPRIRDRRRRAYEREFDRLITEGPPSERRTAAKRPAYFPVTYFVTTAQERAFGFDAASDPARSRAIRLATQLSRGQATPPVTLANSGKPGIVIYQPVFADQPVPPPVPADQAAPAARRERELQGIVSGAYRVDSLVASLRRSVPAGTVLQVRESNTHISGPRDMTDGESARVTAVGRSWVVRASTNRSPSLLLPATVLLTGAALALLVALMLRQGFTRERYALTMVDERMSERDVVQRELEDARATAQAMAAAQSALRRVATNIAAEAPLATVCEMIRAELVQLLDVEDAAVVRYVDGRPVAAGVGASSDQGAPADWLVDDAAADRVIVQSAVRVGDKPWGTIALLNPIGVERNAVEAQLRDFADLAAVAVATAEARQELAVRASTDGLTGLLNRHSFDERLGEEVSRAIRHARPLSLAIIDIDHFKNINDRHGHQAGDAALTDVAHHLRSLARTGDLVARIGGEEFAWIMPETDIDAALVAAERGRAAVGARDRGEIALTISVGVSGLADVATGAALYAHADTALLHAKRSGRNRIVRHQTGQQLSRPGEVLAG